MRTRETSRNDETPCKAARLSNNPARLKIVCPRFESRSCHLRRALRIAAFFLFGSVDDER
jgi:hypothetical protein